MSKKYVEEVEVEVDIRMGRRVVKHKLFTEHVYYIDELEVTKEEYETTKAAFDKELEAFL